MKKKVDDNDEPIIVENPFRRHLQQSFVNKKFNPPQKVLYGFKPVNLLNTFLDDVPGTIIHFILHITLLCTKFDVDSECLNS